MGTTSAWRRLDPSRAAELARARVELHWAAQLAAAPGSSLLPPREDYQHTNLAWSRVHEALVGRAIEDGTRGAVRPRDLALLVISGDEILAEQTLAGRTFAQAPRWLAAEIERRSERQVGELAPPSHDLPDHPVGRGEPFTGDDGAALADLADWYANAHHVLEHVREQHGGTEVRCWPHHFDLASSIARGAPGRSIGVGMSPGDGTEDAPYFYASPWPYPDTRTFPDLPPGARWNSEGWVGALLPGAALDPDAAVQKAQALTFFERAIAACDQLLK